MATDVSTVMIDGNGLELMIIKKRANQRASEKLSDKHFFDEKLYRWWWWGGWLNGNYIVLNE